MNIKQIELNQGEPTAVTVQMSTAEAAFIANLVGDLCDNSANDIMVGGAKIYGEIWAELTGNLFNRFYEGGIIEYTKQAETQ